MFGIGEAASSMGVIVAPGATQLTAMPRSASTRAALARKRENRAFAGRIGRRARQAAAAFPRHAGYVQIRAPLRIRLAASRMHRNVPSTLTS